MIGRYLYALLALVSWGLFAIAVTESESAGQEFNENAVAWQDNVTLRTDGLRAAEEFRLKLLRENGQDATVAQALGTALQEFRERYRAPLADRPTLERFAVTKEEYVKQLQGSQRVAPMAAFRRFSGRWYGRWDHLEVDHHWHDVVLPDGRRGSRELASNDGLPSLVAQQYAWIGDGFGWNYVVRPEDHGDVVLGYVYHVTSGKPNSIRFSFPLVGYFDGPGRLIWVTPSSIYFEEVLNDSDGNECYVITGCNYVVKEGALMSQEQGFQALYTRKSVTRPPWLRFPVNLALSSAAAK